jgi:hypothetical protein
LLHCGGDQGDDGELRGDRPDERPLRAHCRQQVRRANRIIWMMMRQIEGEQEDR